MGIVQRTKAAVAALTSLFGSGASGLTTPVPSRNFGWLHEPYPGAWQGGAVTPDPLGSITAFSAVYASVNRIATDVAKMPALLMQRQTDGTWARAADTSPFWVPLRKPNNFQTWGQFIGYWLTCKLLHGNAYALKVRDGRGMVTALYPLDPRRVTPLVTPQGDVYYSLGGDDLSRVPAGMVVPASEIIHDRCATLWHPLVGVSPIYACAISATQGRRIQSNSATFFENMSRPSGMLTAPGIIDDVTADRLKKTFEQNFGGANIGRLFVTGDGVSYEALTIPAEAAQLIEQLRWTVEDIARAFGIPLYKLNAGPMPSNNNVEALNQGYYGECLQTHIEAIEALLDQGLGLPANMRVEFDLDGLLRMDTEALYRVLEIGVRAAVLSPNEARARVNLGPVTGGESPLAQQQNFSLAALSKRDAKADPFAKSLPDKFVYRDAAGNVTAEVSRGG